MKKRRAFVEGDDCGTADACNGAYNLCQAISPSDIYLLESVNSSRKERDQRRILIHNIIDSEEQGRWQPSVTSEQKP